MGRAKGAASATTDTGARRGATRGTVTTVTTVTTIHELLTHAAPIGDEVLGAAGLAAVDPSRVQALPDGKYRISFQDGSTAIVDLGLDIGEDGLNADLQVAHSAGANATDEERVAALYAALGHKAMYATEVTAGNSDSPLVALGDAYAELYEHDGVPTAEQLVAVAQAAQDLLTAPSADASLTVDPDHLVRYLQPETPMSDRAKQRAVMQSARDRVIDAMAKADQSGIDAQRAAANTLLFPVDPKTGQMLGAPTNEQLAEYASAADALGLKVPELKIAFDEDGNSVGAFELGAAERERMDIIRNAINFGDRTFAFRGPPGSGKGEMAQQMAALTGMGYLPINAGSTMDIEMLAGSDGLARQDVVVEVARKTGDGRFIGMVKQPDGTFSEQPVDQETDETGKPRFDEDTGFPVLKGGAMPATERQTQSLTVSKAMLGQLAMGVQGPYVTEIQEPERMQEGFVRFHSALGEKFGEPDKRYLTLNVSSAVDSGDLIIDGIEKGKKFLNIPVHPEAIIVMTYNPGIDDIKFKQATHDRMTNLDFDYPTKEAECRRLAKLVSQVFTNEERDIPEALRRDWDPDVMEPFVGIAEKLRNAAMENPSFIEAPGSRTVARFFSQVAIQSYLGDNRGDRTARLTLDYVRSYEEKSTTAPDSLVNSILADEIPALQKFSEALYQQGLQDRGEA